MADHNYLFSAREVKISMPEPTKDQLCEIYENLPDGVVKTRSLVMAIWALRAICDRACDQVRKILDGELKKWRKE